MKEGDVVYVKRFTVFHRCTIKKLLPEMGGIAKVNYYSSGAPLTCRQSELVSEEAYKTMKKQQRRDAYLSQRRIDLADVIDHWNAGRRTPMEMLENNQFPDEAAKLKAATKLSRKITSAKKLGFITE